MIVPRAASAALFAVLAVFAALGAFDPAAFRVVTADEAAAEKLGALLFLIAALASAARLMLGRGSRGLDAVVLLFAGGAFLDEISFGETLIGFTAPRLAGVKIDGLHDLLSVAKVLGRRAVGLHADALALAALGVAAAAALRWRRAIVEAASAALLPGEAAAASVCAAAVMVVVAMALDLELAFVPEFVEAIRLEEALELAAAVTLALVALGRGWLMAPSDGAGQAHAAE
jgi:hypothetical protein